MKLLTSRHFWIAIILVSGMTYIGSCTHDDQILDEYVPGGPTVSETDLLSSKVTTAPVVDGTIDAMWADAQKLVGTGQVPDPGVPENNENFNGYIGQKYDFTMRSVYDDENIYFLIEWGDNSLSENREPWYFNPATKMWAFEDRYPEFNDNGVIIRDAFYEDKLAILWNIDNSVPDWNTLTCYASCHTNLGETAGYARHFTNAATERIDMWHWKSVREGVWGTMDDQYQDNTQPNGRKSDPKISGSYTDNIQTLTITGLTTTEAVPKYFIPGRTYYYYITQAEIDNGTAKLITAVDENGILTYDGGTIDPYADLNYQRDGSTSGSKAMPSIYTSIAVGNRGDITCKYSYTGSGWIMELQRKLNTGDPESPHVDVDFSSLQDQYFGIGIFDNRAIAHAIKPGLVLKFKK